MIESPREEVETCASCGADVPLGAASCSHCGAPATRRCPVCGVQPAYADRTCASCGTPLPDPPLEQTQPATTVAPVRPGLSPWWPRVGAMLLDLVLLVIPTLIAESIAAATVANSSSSAAPELAALIAATTVSGLYFGILNGSGRGQTFGNRAAGIGVRDLHTGQVVGLGRSVLRWLVRYVLYVFVVPGILSDLWPLWDPLHQTLADKAAGTVMLRLR